MIGRLVKMKGLNRRTIAVDKHSVHYLEEHEIDGTFVTNVHFSNGKWATAGLPLDEAEAILYSATNESESEIEDEKKQIERWKRMGKARAEAQKEIDEALRSFAPGMKKKSYSK
jgi:hypothetical protein